MILDVSLKNTDLYAGCEIEQVAGRANLTTPMSEAIERVGKNLETIVANCDDRKEITLTGPMAIPVYLTVFHGVVHSFQVVKYDDGKTGPIVVAKHG